MPFGQMPVLEVKDGEDVVVIAQSLAFARFLANKLDLAGKSDLDKARADMVSWFLPFILLTFS
jgi:glutathione S-transferase